MADSIYPEVTMVLEFHNGATRQYEDVVYNDECYVEYDQLFVTFCTNSTSIMYPTNEIKSIRYYASE